MNNIVVCIKQVPDTNDIKWTAENNIQREGLLSILNPQDDFALQCALDIKNVTNAKITVFTMGPKQAEDVLRYAYQRGADEAILLSDKKFSASDTIATARTLGTAIQKYVPDFDLIICGQYALDGDTAQTGGMIASFLDIEYISNIFEVSFLMSEIRVKQEYSEGWKNFKVGRHSLIAVANENFKAPKPKIEDYINAQDREIKVFGADDLGLDKTKTGLLGSLTNVSKVFKKQVSRNLKIIDYNTEKLIEEINKMRQDVK